MLKTLLLTAGLGLAGSASAVWVPCVGGPIQPSYAFNNWNDAQVCRNLIASQSNSCARNVVVAKCWTNWQYVGAFSPFQCRCAPGLPPVGRW